MINRILGTIAAFSAPLVILGGFNVLGECLADGLHSLQMPAFLCLINTLAPIHLIGILIPVAIAILFWRSDISKEQNKLSFWYIFIILGAYLLLSVEILVAKKYTYLNGSREITVDRIVGNIIMIAIVLLCFYFQKRKLVCQN